MFELSVEFIDCGMSWYERRQPLFEMAIEVVFSAEDKTAEPVDDNGRELPLWLKEAEEKETAEKALKYTKHTPKRIAINYCVERQRQLRQIFFQVYFFLKESTRSQDFNQS